MKNIGAGLFGIGVLAIVLNFINMVPRPLMWIYSWGEGVAWVIKLAVVGLGAALWLIANKKGQEAK